MRFSHILADNRSETELRVSNIRFRMQLERSVMPTDPHGPLAGVRVLDASRVLAGPFCGQVLGDLGAEVIKVERPGSGDDTRAWGPPFAGSLSAYYLSCNRNKKGITLDLGQAEGLRLFYELVQRSDVMLENFKASSADRLGLSPEKLLAVNPRLVLCSISGYGRTGPLRDLPGYDYAVQALSGLMSITGPVEGPPYKVGVAVTDILTGLYGAVAILACLHARSQSGHGYAIDLALLDCAVASQVNVVQAYLTSGRVPARQGNAHLQIVPYQMFATADGCIVLAVGNDSQWRAFCKAADRPDLAADARFATNEQRVEGQAVLIPIVEAIMRSQPTKVWEERLIAAGVPHAPVWNYAELFAHPQIAARGLRMTVRDPQGQPVDLVGTPFQIAGASLPATATPPALGQHTDQVLKNVLGIDTRRIDELRRDGVI
jgi:crotonobetainyl-CoA:carnitine CoA-transferase CaiB-like acyl-CoA transferase